MRRKADAANKRQEEAVIIGHTMDRTDSVSHNGSPSHSADSPRPDSRFLLRMDHHRRR